MIWSRLRQSALKFYAYSKQCKRLYHPTRAESIFNQYISPRTLVPILNNPNFIARDGQLEYFHSVRFYAKRAKRVKKSTPKKKEKEDPRQPRVNEEITAPMIRLVTEEGHDVMSFHKAMARAESLGLDLVEVDKQADPPVCKIFDLNKQKFVQRAMEKERAKSKDKPKSGPPKEVRFGDKIKLNDLKVKADMAKRLLDSGYRVKCVAMDTTKDEEKEKKLSHFCILKLSHFCTLIEDVAILESTPKYERTLAYIIARHIRYGPSKKGSGKKASKTALSSVTFDETGEIVEVGSESEHEDDQNNNSEWTVYDEDDDKHKLFNKNNVENVQYRSPSFQVEAPPTNPSGVPKPAMENRYARNPRSATPPRVPVEFNTGDARNNMVNNVPRIPSQVNQSQGVNESSQMRPKQDETNPSGVPKPAMENRYARNPRSATPTRVPVEFNTGDARNNMVNNVPRIQSQVNQSQGVNESSKMRPKQDEIPGYRVTKQDSSRSSSPNSAPKSFGIFSAPKVNHTPNEQNTPAVTNRYKINAPTDSARTTRPPHQRDSPSADPRMNRGLGADNPVRERGGNFSADNSNVNPSKNVNQAEIRR